MKNSEDISFADKENPGNICGICCGYLTGLSGEALGEDGVCEVKIYFIAGFRFSHVAASVFCTDFSSLKVSTF